MEQQERSLKQLLEDWRVAVAGTSHPQPPAYDGPDVTLSGFCEDSRTVQPGQCFVARRRRQHDGRLYSDGHPYIGQAVERGAALVIGELPRPELPLPPDTPYLCLPDSGLALAWLAAAWHGFPAQKLVLIGVTGTDGKTTVVNLIHAILGAAGIPAGMISTIKAVIGTAEEDTGLHVTTPEAPAIQAYLRRMVDAGQTHCVLEVTSHALAQERVAAVAFDIAVVTNISHEHLDFHGSLEGYRAAKMKLFRALHQRPLAWPAAAQPPAAHKQAVWRAAVLNRDDSSYAYLQPVAGRAVVDYALQVPATVTAEAVCLGPQESRFHLLLGRRAGRYPAGAAIPPEPSRPWPVSSRLVGTFNLYNMLAAAAAAHALGIAPPAIQAGLAAVTAISGRMERIDRGQPFQVIVDFAHTPRALEQAIAAARDMTAGRVIAVFGSAGKRDVEKRFSMAEIAARQADCTVLTAEDPRQEALNDILATMARGARHGGGVEGETFWRVPDRGQAIYFALSLARSPQDLVLICGKGHEQSMSFDGVEYPWDDRQATRQALDAFLAGRPMVDLGLPTFSGATERPADSGGEGV